MERNRHKVVLSLLFLGILSIFAIARPIEGLTNHRYNTPLAIKQKVYPIMFIAKLAEKDTVYIGEWFKIRIIISNIGNATAYNLTIYDSKYSNWTIELRNYQPVYRLVSIEPNATIVIVYEARILKTAYENYSLGNVRLVYYDNASKKHEVVSEELTIKVKSKETMIDKEAVYRQWLTLLTIVIISSIVALIYIERKVYLEYQKR